MSIFLLHQNILVFTRHLDGKNQNIFTVHYYEESIRTFKAFWTFFLRRFTEQGFVPEAVVNFVALLGWSSPDNREIFSLEELVEAFDYKHISKSPAVFDMVKLKWMNGEYLKAMDSDTFYNMAEPYIKEVIKKDMDLKKIAALVKTRIEVFPEIGEMIDFFEAVPEYDVDMYTNKKNKTNAEKSLPVLQGITSSN